jgi:hypothetical protein
MSLQIVSDTKYDSKICKIVLWYECKRIIWMDYLLRIICLSCHPWIVHKPNIDSLAKPQYYSARGMFPRNLSIAPMHVVCVKGRIP